MDEKAEEKKTIKDKMVNLQMLTSSDTKKIADFKTPKDMAVVSFINSGKSHTSKVTAPTFERGNKLCLAFIAYLNSNKYRSLSESYKNTQHKTVIRFFDFLDEIKYNESSLDSTLLKVHFISYIKKVTTEKSAYETFSRVRSILDWIVNMENRKDLEHCWMDYFVYLSNSIYQMPLKKPAYGACQTIKDLAQDLDYSNEEYLLSLRRICCIYFDRMSKFRAYFRDKHPDLLSDTAAYINKLFRNSKDYTDDPRIPFYSEYEYLTKGHKKEEHRLLTGRFLQALLDYDDDVLIEQYMFGNMYYLNDVLKNGITKNISDIKEALQEQININTGAMYSEKRNIFNNKRILVGRTMTLDIFHLLYPQLSEIIMITWMLATDRCQPSGQELLTEKDVTITDKNLQIHFFKGRSNKEFQSQIYGASTPVYKAYRDYVQLMSIARKTLSECKIKDALVPLRFNAVNSIISRLSASSSCGLFLIGIEGSVNRMSYERDPKTGELTDKQRPIIDLYSQLIDRHKLAKDERIAELREKRKSGITTENYDKQKRNGKHATLTPGKIANTRVAVDLSRDHSVSDKNMTDLLASLNAHSIETHYNTYKDKTNDKTIVERSQDFSESLGDLMISDSQKLKELLDKTEILSLDEIKITLGIKEPPLTTNDQAEIDNLIAEVDKIDGFELGEASEIIGNGKTYVIESEMTAGMIWGYINHIEKHLDGLASDSQERALKSLTHMIFLKEVFSRFSKSTQKKGKEWNNKYNMPYAELL